jgi:hypothetical protein
MTDRAGAQARLRREDQCSGYSRGYELDVFFVSVLAVRQQRDGQASVVTHQARAGRRDLTELGHLAMGSILSPGGTWTKP